MANAILAKLLTVVTPTITLTSLANGAGRICAQIDNTTVLATRGFVALRIKTGSVAPTANTVFKIYLIRTSNDVTANLQSGRGGTALGTADAAVSVEPVNAECVGTIQVTTGTATTYEELFPVQDPGSKFSFVVWNATGQAADSTPTNHILQWAPIVDEVQQ